MPLRSFSEIPRMHPHYWRKGMILCQDTNQRLKVLLVDRNPNEGEHCWTWHFIGEHYIHGPYDFNSDWKPLPYYDLDIKIENIILGSQAVYMEKSFAGASRHNRLNGTVFETAIECTDPWHRSSIECGVHFCQLPQFAIGKRMYTSNPRMKKLWPCDNVAQSGVITLGNNPWRDAVQRSVMKG